jgi:hypothetical protein
LLTETDASCQPVADFFTLAGENPRLSSACVPNRVGPVVLASGTGVALLNQQGAEYS